jgi:hypothetical protein
LRIEELETRALLSVFTPGQIRHTYGFDQVTFPGSGGQTIQGDGTGQTIAIVDAYDAPNISTDLQAFDSSFTLSNNDGQGVFALTKATPQGQPSYNTGWAQEITLDVEWAHAIAPGAHILLVEAASNSLSNLFGAVDYARSQAGVVAVSMSWGSSEFKGENSYDSYLTTPTGHVGGSGLAGGVTFVASSGDTGALPEYPAVSPNVLGVGGTSLVTADSSGTYSSETAWNGSGGGVSAYEAKPAYQSSVTQSSSKRTSPDVAYDADPNTGVQVYFSGNWYIFGGTSIAAPQWAALVAIADQGRALNGQGSLDSFSQTLPATYNLPAGDFHDITSGSTRYRGNIVSAGPGYDLLTGRGTPVANLVITDLLRVTATGTLAPASGSSGSSGGGAGSPHAAPVNDPESAQLPGPAHAPAALARADLPVAVPQIQISPTILQAVSGSPGQSGQQAVEIVRAASDRLPSPSLVMTPSVRGADSGRAGSPGFLSGGESAPEELDGPALWPGMGQAARVLPVEIAPSAGQTPWTAPLLSEAADDFFAAPQWLSPEFGTPRPAGPTREAGDASSPAVALAVLAVVLARGWQAHHLTEQEARARQRLQRWGSL